MELKIIDVEQNKTNIRVEVENEDKSFSVIIHESEYREWLKYNDYPWSYDHIGPFAVDYLHGIINIDNTANMILGNIYHSLSRTHTPEVNPEKLGRKELKFVCNDIGYMISQNKRSGEFSLWVNTSDGYKEIRHNAAIVELYRIVLMTTRIIHNNPN